MSDDAPMANPSVEIPGHALDEDLEESVRGVRDFIERAREHHARTGEWPPDPLLDEIDEMRRRVQAEHGNDPWKLLAYYNQAGRGLLEQNGGAPDAADRDASAA